MDFRAQLDHRPLIVDSFAGGGGASTGIEMALGRSPDIAINHNAAALALHAANHPDTLHLSQNVWQVDPLDYVDGRHVGLAWFSPDCKHFSKAKGGKPVERNIRDLAWVVVLWAERVKPDVILLENVEEFRDWGPLVEEDRGGKVVLMPDPAARNGVHTPEEPLRTQATAGSFAVAVPTLVGCGGRAGQSRPRGGDEPMATQTAKADVCVATAYIAQNNTDVIGRAADEPLSTIVQKGCTQSVVAAHLMTMRNAQKPWQGADDPAHTVTAGGAGQTLVNAFISRQFGASVGHSLDDPSGSVTADVNKSAVVAPFVQKYYGTGDGARLDEPCHSVTTRDRFGFVEGAVDVPPFTEAQAVRAREVAAFLRAHGFWDEREFVTIDIATGDQVETFTIVDIGMRMLTPRELFSAQGFPPDYVIDLDFQGKPLPKDAQISCCGNSVCPPLAAALVGANCAHLAAYQEAAE